MALQKLPRRARTSWRRKLLSAVLALAWAGSAIAEPATTRDLQRMSLGSFVDAASLEDLANMVVTDTKIAQSATSVTQKIIVIHQDEIERQSLGTRNLAELLRYTSGQFVNVLSRNDANWGAYAGLGPKYNSYLLDGLPIDSFVDAMSLSPEILERVEMHKGPASVLYSNYLTMDFAGNVAPLAGTTNFVLRRQVDETLTRISAGAGNWDTYAGRAYHQGRQGDLSYFVGGNIERSNYTQYGLPDSWLQTVENPDYRKSRLFGSLNYDFGRPDHSAALFLHHTDHTGDVGRPNRDFDNRYDTLNFSYNNRFSEDWHVQFKYGDRRYDRQYSNDNWSTSLALTGSERVRQTIRPMDLTFSYRHGGDSLLTAGVDSQSVNYRTSRQGTSGPEIVENDATARSTGYFLQEKVHWKDWIFRAGVRHNDIQQKYELLGGNRPDTDTASWHKNLWSLGLRYNLDKTVAIYANAGTSFMVPAAKQIGGTVSSPGGSGQLANASLRPESGLGRDLGVDWKPLGALSLGARYFMNTIDDAIVDSAVGSIQSISQNAGRTEASGIELDVTYEPSDSVAGFFNLTRSHSRIIDSTVADQVDAQVPLVPELVANLGVLLRLPGKTTLQAYYHWVGTYYDSASRNSRIAYGDYGVASVRVNKDYASGLGLMLEINNLGDRRYDMPYGFQNPGVSVFAGLTQRF